MASPFILIKNQISRYFITRRHAKQLRLAVNHTAAIRRSDVLLVACLRNELVRMPFFCDYYRKLGVNHFLFVDNDSDDGFLDWAAGNPDVSVWHTKASYRNSKYGMEWCNVLLRRYGVGHLCVTVDPDEFLVYPHIETRSLRDLGEFMKIEKRNTFHVLMLDAYSDKPLTETTYEMGDDPFKVCPYFDRDGYVQIISPQLSHYTRGGPRMRVHNRNSPLSSPALNKVPVVWWKWNYRYSSSTHDMRPMRLNQSHNQKGPFATGCLFHFKFIASMKDKAAEEMHRKQHYAAGDEYRLYFETANPVMFEEGISIAYKSPQQLIALGLMSPANWF